LQTAFIDRTPFFRVLSPLVYRPPVIHLPSLIQGVANRFGRDSFPCIIIVNVGTFSAFSAGQTTVETNPVEYIVCGQRERSELSQGGYHIGKIHQSVRHVPRGGMTFPVSNQRNVNAVRVGLSLSTLHLLSV